MRWLYPDSTEPPFVPPVVPPDEWDVTELTYQPALVMRVVRDSDPDQWPSAPTPSIFSTYDAFEQPSWSPSETLTTHAASPRMNAAVGVTGGKGGGGRGGLGGPKKKDPDAQGWIIGTARPIPLSDYPWGGGGVTPLEQTINLIAGMSCPRFARGSRVAYPLQGHRGPFYFGGPDMPIDWEPPVRYEFFRRARLKLDEQIESDVPREEEITLDKWYTPFTQQRPEQRFRSPPLEVFVNLDTDYNELIHLDKWDTPLTPKLPWRVLLPIAVLPFQQEGNEPLEEANTLDKWYTSLSEPVRTPPWLRLDQGVLFPVPIPDDPELAFQLYGWRSGDQLPAWPRTFWPVPRMEGFQDLATDEEPTVDKYETPLVRLPLWAPRLPIALFPFRLEGDEPREEVITLDKWYTSLAAPDRTFRQVRAGQQWRRSTAPWQVFQAELWVVVEELIESDKWYTRLSHPFWPAHVLRQILGVLPEDPILDIPGLPIDYWLTALQQPLAQPRVLPTLYQPLQQLYDQPYQREVPWPRRRTHQAYRRGR